MHALKGIRMVVGDGFICRALCALLLLGCGGGGGGGDKGETTSTTGVRILHAAIDAAPVDVVVSGVSEPVARKAVFALDDGYHALPSGSLNLLLTRAANPGSILDSFAVTADERSKFSILLCGDNTTFGLRTALLTDEPPTDRSRAHIRIVDGVTGAAAIVVRVSSQSEVQEREIPFGEASEYISVSGDTASIRVVRAVDGRVISSGSVGVKAGQAYTYLIAGELDYFVKPLLLID